MVVMITIVVMMAMMMAMMMVMIMVSQEMAVDDDANIIDMADLKRPEANITCHGGSNMTRTTLPAGQSLQESTHFYPSTYIRSRIAKTVPFHNQMKCHQQFLLIALDRIHAIEWHCAYMLGGGGGVC